MAKPIMQLAKPAAKPESGVYNVVIKRNSGLAKLLAFTLDKCFGMPGYRHDNMKSAEIREALAEMCKFALAQVKVEIPVEIDAELTVDSAAEKK